MNHYVYETTNLINGKKYIGKRSCKCEIENDRYIGSGKLLKKAIRKYGKESFSKRILIICETEEEAYIEEEKFILENDSVESEMYYNVAGCGKGTGSGKNHPRYGVKLSKEQVQRMIDRCKNNPISEDTRRRMREAKKGKMIGADNHFYGKKHTEEARAKMSIASSSKTMPHEARMKISKALSGKNSPMYGKSKTIETRIKISESRKGKSLGGDNHWAKKVLCVTTGEVFESLSDAGRKYNISVPNITACCKGRRKRAGGMEWEYSS